MTSPRRSTRCSVPILVTIFHQTGNLLILVWYLKITCSVRGYLSWISSSRYLQEDSKKLLILPLTLPNARTSSVSHQTNRLVPNALVVKCTSVTQKFSSESSQAFCVPSVAGAREMGMLGAGGRTGGPKRTSRPTRGGILPAMFLLGSWL
jgi:hypothetical protein